MDKIRGCDTIPRIFRVSLNDHILKVKKREGVSLFPRIIITT